MEQFYYQPATLYHSVSFVKALAFIDLFGSAGFLYLLLIWTNITITFSFMALFNVLHAFSWMAGLASSSGMYAHEYLLMTGMIYIVAFLADLGGLIWRTVVFDSTDSFQIGGLIFNSLFILVDVLMVVVLGILLSQTKRFSDSVYVAIEASATSSLEVSKYSKIPYRLYTARSEMRIASTLDLFLFLLLSIMFALGLGITAQFQRLFFMQIPHSFLWVAGMGIDKRVADWGFVVFFCLLYGIAILLDFSSVVWRSILVAQCTSCVGAFEVIGWIFVGIVAVMTVISFFQVYLGIVIIRQMHSEFMRLLPLVREKLYPREQRFYYSR